MYLLGIYILETVKGAARGGGAPPPLPSFYQDRAKFVEKHVRGEFYFEETIIVGSYLGCMCKL